MADEWFVFTAFVAVAQIVVGLVLVLAGFSSAVQIIGGVVLALGCLTAAGPLVGRRRERNAGDRPEPPPATTSSPS